MRAGTRAGLPCAADACSGSATSHFLTEPGATTSEQGPRYVRDSGIRSLIARKGRSM
jgi:hypothetical protein